MMHAMEYVFSSNSPELNLIQKEASAGVSTDESKTQPAKQPSPMLSIPPKKKKKKKKMFNKKKALPVPAPSSDKVYPAKVC